MEFLRKERDEHELISLKITCWIAKALQYFSSCGSLPAVLLALDLQEKTFSFELENQKTPRKLKQTPELEKNY